MPDLTPDNETLINLVYGVVAFVIANTMVCLYLLNKYLEEKRKNRSLRNTQSEPLSKLKDYFEQQFSATKKYNSTAPKVPLHKEVIALRSAYLKIEREALNAQIESRMYWKTLNINLYKLVKILMPQLFSREAEVKNMEEKIALMKQRINKLPIDPNDKKAQEYQTRALASLDQFANRFRHAGEAQKRIGGYVDKMKNVVELFEDPTKRRTFIDKKRQLAYIERSKNELNTLEHNAHQNSTSINRIRESLDDSVSANNLKEELQRFQVENKRLNDYVTNLKNQIKSSQIHLESATTDLNSTGKNLNKLDLHEVSDEILEANEREIDRLRDIINKQRTSIYSMEGALTNLTPPADELNEGESEEQRDSRIGEIDQLKKCIQESEICIEMLEKELELLKCDLNQLRHPTESEGGISGAETEQLSQELDQVKTELDQVVNRSNQQEQLLRFVSEALNARSLEDISLLIYEAIVSLNFTPSLIIKLPNKNIDVTGHGTMATRDKVMIDNMRIDEVNPNANGDLALRFLHIGGILRPGEWHNNAADDHEYLVQLTRMADRIIHNIIQTQKSKNTNRVIHDCVNNLKQTSYDLDKMLENQCVRTKSMVSNTIGQIQDIARSKGMGASHIASFKAIEQEALHQIDADKSVRLRVRKKFLALVNDMESNNN